MQKRIFHQLASEMIENGFQIINPPGWDGPEYANSYYRHPEAYLKVVIRSKLPEGDLLGRTEELAAELRKRFHTPLRGCNNYTGEPWVNYRADPWDLKISLRRYARYLKAGIV